MRNQAASEQNAGTGTASKDHDFVAMISAYRHTGGAAREEELRSRLEAHKRTSPVSLASLLVAGEVFAFEWHGILWIPLFQFDPADMLPRTGLRQVLSELDLVFDGWARAVWFIKPNRRLQYRSPVDVFQLDLDAVLDAAREDRLDVVADLNAEWRPSAASFGTGT